MAQPTLASAVVLPDPPSPSQGIKRQHTASPPSSPKRQRISPSPSQPQPSPPHVHPDRARKTSVTDTAKSKDARTNSRPGTGRIDEKKRTQRLFGALLGNLRAPSSGSAAATSARRAEIQERKRAELRRKEAELALRETERAEALRERRWRVQRRVDREGLRVRHAGLRARAGFLRTEIEPRLYWRPWVLRQEEVGRVEAQRESVEGVIEGEIREWEESNGERYGEEDRHGRGGHGEDGNGDERSEEMEGRGAVEEGAKADPQDGEGAPSEGAAQSRHQTVNDASVPHPTPNVGDGVAPELEQTTEPNQDADQVADGDEDAGEHGDGVVVEAEEDTVIY